jgi:hypothetical protein
MQKPPNAYFESDRLNTTIVYSIRPGDNLADVASAVQMLAKERNATVRFMYLGDVITATPQSEPGSVWQQIVFLQGADLKRIADTGNAIFYTCPAGISIEALAQRMVGLYAEYHKPVLSSFNDIQLIAHLDTSMKDIVAAYTTAREDLRMQMEHTKPQYSHDESDGLSGVSRRIPRPTSRQHIPMSR